MSKLSEGTTLDWDDTKNAAVSVRTHGIEQLIVLWKKYKDRDDDVFLWGDEMEAMLVSFNDDRREVEPCLRAADILEKLDPSKTPSYQLSGTRPRPEFQPEGASYMVEVIPGKPWGISPDDLLDVEPNMFQRRALINEQMESNECFMTLASFPGLGAKSGPAHCSPLSGEIMRSQYLGDEVISTGERYQNIIKNFRLRRERKVAINVPVFRDEKTPWPFSDPTVDYNLYNWPEDDEVRNGAVEENHIYMDSAIFGAGCCSLQVTVQAKNIHESRRLYDQLLQLGPIILALTAATPIAKGFLADTDVRNYFYRAATDDRTTEELGEKPLRNNRRRISKSRCATNSTYISQDPRLRKEYLDPDLTIDEEIKQKLLASGMDELLATHFAHLFIRDPLLVYEKDIEVINHNETTLHTNLFETIQSTNWGDVRFKPPPSLDMDNQTGWRVEFRPMEVQPSEFENAAFAIFIVLFVRTLLALDLSLYIPIKKVSENMETAHTRDAVLHGQFHWRQNPFSTPVDGESEEYELLTIDEIVNGQDSGGFPGLVPLVRRYLDSQPAAGVYGGETRGKLDEYLDFIGNRANGFFWTNARWMRHFVRHHPDYKYDSVVGPNVLYDLLKTMRVMTDKRVKKEESEWGGPDAVTYPRR